MSRSVPDTRDGSNGNARERLSRGIRNRELFRLTDVINWLSSSLLPPDSPSSVCDSNCALLALFSIAQWRKVSGRMQRNPLLVPTVLKSGECWEILARNVRESIQPRGFPREGLITAIKEVLSRRAPDIDTPLLRLPPSLPPSFFLFLCLINILLLSEDTAVRHRRPPLPLDRCGSSVENRPVDLSRDPLEPCRLPPLRRSPRPVLRPRRGTRLVFRAANASPAGAPLDHFQDALQFRGAREGHKNLGPRSLSLSLSRFPLFRRASRILSIGRSPIQRAAPAAFPSSTPPSWSRQRRLNRVWPTSRTRITEEFGRPVADHYPKTTFVSFAGGTCTRRSFGR